MTLMFIRWLLVQRYASFDLKFLYRKSLTSLKKKLFLFKFTNVNFSGNVNFGGKLLFIRFL
jgi:hypothetical protein